jgi:hypothetical protein
MIDRWESVLVDLDEVHQRLLGTGLLPGTVSTLKKRADDLYGQAKREIVRTNAHPTIRWYRLKGSR